MRRRLRTDPGREEETSMIGNRLRSIGSLLPFCLMLLAGCAKDEPGRVMDDGLALTREEIQGRNTWIVWTGGNDRFWNRISIDSFGAFDLLKIISSHEKLEASRDNRWN